jgi:hypothetical protein
MIPQCLPSDSPLSPTSIYTHLSLSLSVNLLFQRKSVKARYLLRSVSTRIHYYPSSLFWRTIENAPTDQFHRNSGRRRCPYHRRIPGKFRLYNVRLSNNAVYTASCIPPRTSSRTEGIQSFVSTHVQKHGTIQASGAGGSFGAYGNFQYSARRCH